MPSRTFSTRLSLFNAFLFLGGGVQTPFLPLWLKFKGLATYEIAVVMAAMVMVRVVAMPVGAFLADYTGDRRRVIIIAALAAFASYCVLAFTSGFIPILIMATLAGALFAPVAPLAEVFSIEGSQHHGLDYGRIRLWASVSFLAGSLISGALLETLAVSWVIYLIIAAQGLGAVVAFLLPTDPLRRAAHEEPVKFSSMLAVVTAAPFIIFLAAAGIGQSSHGLFYAIGAVHWDNIGHGKFTIGALWAAAVIFEVLFFAFSSLIAGRIDPTKLIVIGVAGGVLRWLLFAFDPPLWVLYPASALHFASFGVTHFGTMHYLQQHVPPGMRNTVQGVFSALSGGILLSAVMWSSGPLYDAFAGYAYFFMAAISAIALGLALILVKVNPTAPAARAA
jgi:MFS transporter, PPP family, 3-phenylpropionic acid transporter